MHRFVYLERGVVQGVRMLWDTHTNYAVTYSMLGAGHSPEHTPISYVRLTSDIVSKPDLWVTGRDLNEYPKQCRKIKFSPTIQYAETACGVGGFLEHAVEHLNGRGKRVIAIDPANFDYVKILASELQDRLDRSGLHRQILADHQRRIALLQDPSKINFFNMTLESFAKQHPDLLDSIDVVVDSRGASYYGAEGNFFGNLSVGTEKDAKDFERFKSYFSSDTEIITERDDDRKLSDVLSFFFS